MNETEQAVTPGSRRTILPNARAYDRAGTGDHSLFSNKHCCVCGRACNGRAAWLLLTRAMDGTREFAISSPEDATDEERDYSMWIAPIGSDCLRKHPELAHAVIVFGSRASVVTPQGERIPERIWVAEAYGGITYKSSVHGHKHHDDDIEYIRPDRLIATWAKKIRTLKKGKSVFAVEALEVAAKELEATLTSPVVEHSGSAIRSDDADVDEAFRCVSTAPVTAPVSTGEQPLCAVHRRLEDANALECEIGNDCVACSLNERRELLQLIAPFAAAGNTEDSVTVLRRVGEFYETHAGDGRVVVSYPAPASTPDNSFRDLLPLLPIRVAPGEYHIKARDGRMLWWMDGAALADWICASVNGYDAAVNAIALPTEHCARCGGSGEVEGYGGNNVYCGHCAGTGRKPIFAATSTTPDGEHVAKLQRELSFYFVEYHKTLNHQSDALGCMVNDCVRVRSLCLSPATTPPPAVTEAGEQERETLIYWLLRCYESGHRQGWEPGPNTDETMSGLLSVLANRGYDPKDKAAKDLVKQPARY